MYTVLLFMCTYFSGSDAFYFVFSLLSFLSHLFLSHAVFKNTIAYQPLVLSADNAYIDSIVFK